MPRSVPSERSKTAEMAVFCYDEHMKTAIFDFDGTIADSFDVFVETLQELVKLPKPLSSKDIEELRGLHTREVIKKLHVHWWQLPRFVREGRRKMAAKIDHVEIFPGLKDAVRLLADSYNLYIISSNDMVAIQSFLEVNGLTNCFISIQAGAKIGSKKRHIRKLIRQNKLNSSDCVYVCDEVRDVRATKAADIKSIAVTWGYSTRKALEEAGPDALVDTPRLLPGVIDDILRGVFK